MSIYQTKAFYNWAKKHEVNNTDLILAIEELDKGLNVVYLGGYLYKKRMGTKGRGKSSSVRTIIAYKYNDKAFFLHGYEKNEKQNINDKEKITLKELAQMLLALTQHQLEQAILKNELKEISNGKR